MPSESYLAWVLRNTKTTFWHDSADPRELELGLQRGAVGSTTNPYLASLALANNRSLWAPEIRAALASSTIPEERAEALMRIPVAHVAGKFRDEFQRSDFHRGWVCAQVNPSRAGDRDRMLDLARRYHAWAPNITVKLPATAAGLDVVEDCIAEGITATATVSFTVSQVLAVAERHRRGIARAKSSKTKPGHCFAVLMVGRLDDYLREVADDNRADVKETDIQQAGIAIAKRAYAMLKAKHYDCSLIIAALRGTYHMTELAGAEVIMSIAPGWQQPLMSAELPKESRIDREVPKDVIDRLCCLPDFEMAYEPNGLSVNEYISYGVTQRTLAQFVESGWRLMENFQA